MKADENDETIRRILGPAGPELLCDECFEVIDVYVDLELSGAPADERIPGTRAHLEGCPACSEEHASLLALASSGAQSDG
jgi:hypothetical protein